MLFGLDGVEIGLIIVFFCLFGGILSGFPVAFAIGGAGVISFGIIAALDSAGLLIHQAIDTGSQAYAGRGEFGCQTRCHIRVPIPGLAAGLPSRFLCRVGKLRWIATSRSS